MRTQSLLLKDMDCDACERLVTLTLSDVPGVHKVQANQREVEVTFDENTTSTDVLHQALDGIGHAG